MSTRVDDLEAIWEEPIEEHSQAPIYDVRIMHKRYPEDWGLLPFVIQRVQNFSDEFEEQANNDVLASSLSQAFVMDDAPIMLIAFLRDDKLIGHLMAERMVLYGKQIVQVHQYQLDHGVPTEARNQMLKLLKGWAKLTDLEGKREPSEYIQWLVRGQKLAILYQRVFKAKPHLLLMRMATED